MGLTNVDQLVTTGKIPLLQRVVTIAAASSTSVHAAQTLADGAVTEKTTDITNPDEYRCLQIVGNAAGINGVVRVIGTNWRGERQEESITANGTTVVEGTKPFRTVTKIIFPARNASGNTISVGCCNKIGLYAPVAAAADVLQVGRKAAAATGYTVEAVGTVNVANGTVKQGTAITADDSLEIAYLASSLG